MKNFELINFMESLVGWLAIYLSVWWVVIYMVLPFGVRMPKIIKKGHATSAPEKPRIKEKFILTTIISVFITLPLFLLSHFKIVDFQWLLFGVKG